MCVCIYNVQYVHVCVYMYICQLFNPPFLILKVRHPAVTGVYCIVWDSRSGCSNDFKCICHTIKTPMFIILCKINVPLVYCHGWHMALVGVV